MSDNRGRSASSKMRMFTLVLRIFCLFLMQIHLSIGHADIEKLLLVSFDGFRWDYLDMVKKSGKNTPHFDALIKEGVVAETGMKNVFVTKTFPNHYALVTGMYEENHGVVGNVMYDPKRNQTVQFTASNSGEVDPDDPYWWTNGDAKRQPEPIWITNQKGQKNSIFKRRSGIMFWPGSTAKRRGEENRPRYYVKYDSKIKNKTRIDNIVKWFSTEKEPINLGLLYFSEPDHRGHQVGPYDPTMIDMIVALDGVVGYLIEQLKLYKLYHHLNIIITSDHGMAQLKAATFLGDHPGFSDLVKVCVGHSPGLNIIPKEGKREELLNILRGIDDIYVYTKNSDTPIPPEYHYHDNDRILDIVVAGKLHHDVVCGAKNPNDTWTGTGGNHGYNNSQPEMHPFFIARGPAFKKNYVSQKQFHTVDVYPLICKILELDPGPHDGKLEDIEHILSDEEEDHLPLLTFITSNKESSEHPEIQHKYKVLLSVMFAAMVAGVFSIAACRVYRVTKYRKRQLVLPLNMVSGKVPLLASDEEEEIP